MTINVYKILKLKSNKFDIAAPSYEQVFAWFRNKGLFHSIILEEDFLEDETPFGCEIRNSKGHIITLFYRENYEQAKIELLKRLIEIYRNGK